MFYDQQEPFSMMASDLNCVSVTFLFTQSSPQTHKSLKSHGRVVLSSKKRIRRLGTVFSQKERDLKCVVLDLVLVVGESHGLVWW